MSRSKEGGNHDTDAIFEIAGVQLTNPDKILYPDQRITKRMLAEYYEATADWILPHVIDRPLSLVRCPQGRSKKCFYQRHYDESLPEHLYGIDVQEAEGDKEAYIYFTNRAGLISLVQIGALELHPWGSKIDRLEQPDRMVFDLDPDSIVAWKTVVAAAEKVRQRLDALGLTSYVKTSGGKGLHVVVPLARRTSWESLAEFAAALAVEMARREPDQFVATMSKSRRSGKIFIDHFRNNRAATNIAAYSTRARAGAPVSTPVTWDELHSLESPRQFSVANLPVRLSKLSSDPWYGFFDLRQSITKHMRSALGLVD